MAAQRGKKAPDQEWVLMYRGGLTRGRIGELVRAAPKTVGYHLSIARAGDPALQGAHEAAAALKATHAANGQGMERMRQLVAMVQESGRYPSRTAESTPERTLAAWLRRRGDDARAGTLAPAYRDGLAVLPGWQTPPRAEAFEARWRARLESSQEKSMTWGCGCTRCGPRCAVVHWIRPKPGRWMKHCRAGGRAGAETPTQRRCPLQPVKPGQGPVTGTSASHRTSSVSLMGHQFIPAVLVTHP
jgi:hypothetical protein